MIGLQPSTSQDNLRNLLGIPEDVVVFGRHGGQDTFDLEFSRNIIRKVVRDFSNIYFVFVNTPEFDQHPHIFFLPKIVKEDEKNCFISTCDAHLECNTITNLIDSQ